MAALVRTEASAAQLVLRLAVAGVLWPHGAQKALGWWGGYGFEGTVAGFAGMGIPAALTVLVIAAEFLGPIALVLGLGGRIAALGVMAVMVGAAKQHLANGFFMDWGGTLAGEGFEFHILMFAMAAAILIAGSGALSLDRRIAQRLSA